MNPSSEETEFIGILTGAARGIGIRLSGVEIEQFREFRRELFLWNSKMNLVSLRTSLYLPIKHCIDSLLAVASIRQKNGQLLDIGSGAGFPGIPLKIVMDALSVTLLDASRKKISFLKHVIGKLRLEHAAAVQGQVELLALSSGYQGAFNTAISRAAFKLPDLLKSAAPFLAPGGRLIAMKGKVTQESASEYNEALCVAADMDLSLEEKQVRKLPLLGDERIILVFSKA